MDLRARRSIVRVAVAVALIVAVFALLTSAYNPRGSLQVEGEQPQSESSVVLDVTILDIEPAEYSARLRVRIVDVDPALLNSDGRLIEPLRVAITSGDGTDDVVFPAGSALGRAEVTIGLTGVESSYPFDRHTAQVQVNAALPGETDSALARAYLTSSVLVNGGSAGWDTTAVVQGQGSDDVLIDVLTVRSGTVKVAAFLIVAIGLMLAVSALTIGLAVEFGFQRVDSSILGWGAGLFFALLALRFYLPGDPPIGSAIDVFGYLWIIVFAFAGLSLTVWSWLQRPRLE